MFADEAKKKNSQGGYICIRNWAVIYVMFLLHLLCNGQTICISWWQQLILL